METKKPIDRRVRVCSLVVEGVFMLLGAVVSVFSLTNLEFMGAYCIGSGFLPFWYGLLIAGISLILMINTLRGKYDVLKSGLPDKEELVIMLTLIVIIVGTIIFMPTLGMNMCIFIYLLLTMKLVERQSWKLTILTAVFGTLAIWLVFDVAFKINFPTGILGF